ncbi:MAG TPA: hypothetical protein VIO60_11705 [Rectinemataceae bacterium]
MRKIIIALAIALMAISFAVAAPSKNVPAIIGIHVGQAHPAFVESLYPDIKFYYLPDYGVSISLDKKNVGNSKATLTAGEGVVADWFKEKGVMAFPRYKALLFDKAGVCAFEGWLQTSPKSSTDEKYKMQNASINFGDKKPLKDFLNDYVQKGKTAKANAKKSLVKDKDYLGGGVPDIALVNSAGEARTLADIVAESGPSLVFFFVVPSEAEPEYVSRNAQSNSMAQNAGNAPTPGAFLGAMLGAQIGWTYTDVLDQIELDFFGYLVNKAR